MKTISIPIYTCYDAMAKLSESMRGGWDVTGIYQSEQAGYCNVHLKNEDNYCVLFMHEDDYAAVVNYHTEESKIK